MNIVCSWSPLHQRLGPHAMARDLVELSVEDTPYYDLYEDKSQIDKVFPMLDVEPKVTPEWGEQYVKAEILFLRGNIIARGQVLHQKQDAQGNPISKFN